VKSENIIPIVVLSIIIGILTMLLLLPSGKPEVVETKTYVDTIPYYLPVAKDSTIVKVVTQKVKVVHRDTTHTNMTDTLHYMVADSAEVEIPITQKVYEEEDYKAYISGYMPSLDSIKVYKHSTVTTIQKAAPRFSMGVQSGIGYGIISKKIEPYIGIGVQIRLGK
jgi:hypothetical protein